MSGKVDADSVKRLDKSHMLSLISGFPEQLKHAREIGKRIDFAKGIKRNFNKVVFCGLGGSAIGADIIRSYVSDECAIPLFVNRDYTLPAFVDKETLVVVSSYSGNTEETLSSYDEAKKRGSSMVTITTNGRVQEAAGRDGLPCIVIPKGLPPRCALGYSCVPLIVLFSMLGLIGEKDSDIEEAAGTLAAMRDGELNPAVGQEKNISKRIASATAGKYAIIYGANSHIDSVVTRWRGQFAENSKALSSTHLFPEMNHNEIVGWENPKDLMKHFAVIMLRDRGDHPRVSRRMEISSSIMKKTGAQIIGVDSRGEGLLGRIFSLIYIGDFASLYLAILNGADPTPVDNVTYLKKELAKI